MKGVFYIGTFLGGWSPSESGSESNSAQSASNGSSGFLPWLIGVVASNASGSPLLGSAAQAITAGMQAYNHTDLHQQLDRLPLAQQFQADLAFANQLANGAGNAALDLIGIPQVTNNPSGKPSGRFPSVGVPSDGVPGVSGSGEVANTGSSPFQDAGFGSEYDFAYNLMHKLAQENNEWSAAQAQAQMAFQERISSSAHQREVADLQAAGLNPVLSAGGSGASSPSGAMGNTDTSATSTIAQLALHAIDGLANTAQGMASVHSMSQNDNSFWGRLNHFYTSNRLGHDLIYNLMSTVSRLPYMAMRMGR